MCLQHHSADVYVCVQITLLYISVCTHSAGVYVFVSVRVCYDWGRARGPLGARCVVLWEFTTALNVFCKCFCVCSIL